MKIPVVFLLLAAGLEAVLAEDKYFEIGGKLSLKPKFVPKEGITTINWKHEGNFVAEWTGNSPNYELFGAFKDRTDLNTTTGELTIRSMTKKDQGIFSVEVNNIAQAVGYSAKGITHLRDKKVEAVVRPVACTFNLQHCSLSCQADVADAGPVEYFWQRDEGLWEKSQDENININNDEKTRLINTFSCKIKNLISEKDSEPLKNPFTPEKQSNVGLVVGIIFLVLLILAGMGLSVYAYIRPQKFAPFISCLLGPHDQKQTEEQPQPIENNMPDPPRTEADSKASNKTSSQPKERSELTPLQVSETGTTNGAPDSP